MEIIQLRIKIKLYLFPVLLEILILRDLQDLVKKNKKALF
jgi:hypothetical protein